MTAANPASSAKLWQKLLLAFGSLVVTLCVLEAVMRFVPDAHRQLVYPSPIPGLGYQMEPDITGISSANRVVHINHWGYRGPDFLKEKPAGTFRVAVIGDSVVYGEAGEDDDMSSTLQRALNAAPILPPKADPSLAPKSYHAMNLGVPAYNSCQELVTLNKIADGFSPDLVIVGYVMNDPEGIHAPFGLDLATGKLPWWVWLYHRIKRHSALVTFTVHKLSPAVANLRGRAAFAPTNVNPASMVDYTVALHDPKGAYWPSCAECIRGFGRYQEEKKVPVLFVILPLFDYLDSPQLAGIYKQVQREAAAAGMQTLVVADAMKGLSPAEIDRYKGDGVHPSKEGHIFLGNLFHETLRRHPELMVGRGNWRRRPGS